MAGRALEELGISLEKVREEVIKSSALATSPTWERCLYPRAKRVLELAVDEPGSWGISMLGPSTSS